MHFDGSNDEVYLTPANNIPIGGDARTIELMMKTTATSGMLFNYGQDYWVGGVTGEHTDGSFKIFLEAGKASFTQGNTTVASNTSVNDGQWHHIAVTYVYGGTYGTVKVYVDGVLKASNATMDMYTKSPADATSALTIGSANGSNYFAGQIDEVKIWNIVRTASQISSSRNCEIASDAAELVLYYQFNQGFSEGDNTSITTVTDASSKALHGTMKNFAKTGSTSNFLTTSQVYAPVAPTLKATTVSLCQGSMTHPLTAIGTNLKWYTVATGGTGSTTAISPNTATVGTTSYWVANATTVGCEGPRAKIDVTINVSGLAITNNSESFSKNDMNCFESTTCDKQSAMVLPINTGVAGFYPVTGNIQSAVYFEATQPADYIKRHHQLTPSNNPDISSGVVTLYYTQADFDDYNAVILSATKKLPANTTDAVGKANFRVKKYSGTSIDGSISGYASTPIIIDPSDDSIVWNSAASRWEITFVVNGFSGFFGTNAQNSALPVELISFKGKSSEGRNYLSWTTASEQDNKGFYVERSDDGKRYETLDFVQGAGTTTQSHDYYATDTKPLYGINYYRLKQVDYSGNFKYSNTITLNSDVKTKTIVAYPNPSDGNIKLLGQDITSNKGILFNSLGQMYNVTITQNELHLENMPAGIYYLQLENNSEKIKIIKN